MVKEKYYSEKDTIVIGGGTYEINEKYSCIWAGIPGQPELAHQADEYIEIEELLLNAEIYAKAIYELAKIIIMEEKKNDTDKFTINRLCGYIVSNIIFLLKSQTKSYFSS